MEIVIGLTVLDMGWQANAAALVRARAAGAQMIFG